MNKSDLKNGMSFKTRNNNWYDIIRSEIFKTAYEEYSLKYEATLKVFLSHYSDDLKNIHSNKFDIIEVYDIDGELIWERDKVDWSKIPRDTKVYVRQNQEDEWELRYFTYYENNKFYTYSNGRTFWSDSFVDLEKWNYCELAENPKKEITRNELQKKFYNFCVNCHECEYSKTKLDCELCWIFDNYNLTEK